MTAVAIQFRRRTVEGLERDLVRLLIFLGRYARQPRSELLDMTMNDLNMWAQETQTMLKEEEEAAKRARED